MVWCAAYRYTYQLVILHPWVCNRAARTTMAHNGVDAGRRGTSTECDCAAGHSVYTVQLLDAREDEQNE